ncbi:hypothetical protein BD779DRAFT_1708891 [Infundibulicybe gibba]|nr:hypothetical protein BD779DRAFT_1708891 [Infundibulicybe gibba]
MFITSVLPPETLVAACSVRNHQPDECSPVLPGPPCSRLFRISASHAPTAQPGNPIGTSEPLGDDSDEKFYVGRALLRTGIQDSLFDSGEAVRKRVGPRYAGISAAPENNNETQIWKLIRQSDNPPKHPILRSFDIDVNSQALDLNSWLRLGKDDH